MVKIKTYNKETVNYTCEKTIFVFLVLNWIELAMEAQAGEYIRNHLHVKRFPRISLVCKLQFTTTCSAN